MSEHICPERCQKHSDKRKTVVLRDPKGGRSEYRAQNPKQRTVTVLEVDGCCIKQDEACDFLMLADNDDAWLIELKGSDVIKAIQQINATLDVLEKKLQPRAIHARIVPTRFPTPNIVTMHEQKLRKRLGGKEQYRCQNRVLEETL